MKKKTIYRLGEEGQTPYLIRYSIFSCRWFAIKLHHILLSDDDCMHDHPWGYISLILKGGYTEHYIKHVYTDHPDPTNPDYTYSFQRMKKWFGPGSILKRDAYWIHRLEVTKPAWTLVITFRKIREWGFYTKLRGWVPHYQYSSKDRC